ncbi:MAG: hypothetical protein ABJO01_11280 [Parasphingorhabdus sp.]|uniref:hypothetical protein n=1 Tax=Parasphingorhabdus sp. TaxID=2709688 RepID=UPI0032969ECC
MNAALTLEDDPPHYLLAFDASLMVQESRHEEAKDRYRECLARLPDILGAEESYVSLYCRLMLGLYDENCLYEELEELHQNATSLGVGGTTKYFLPIGSKSLLLDHYGNRTLSEKPFNWQTDPTIPSQVQYSPSFDRPAVPIKNRQS